MTFNIYRAKFQTTTESVCKFPFSDTLKKGVCNFVNESDKLRIYMNGHFSKVGDVFRCKQHINDLYNVDLPVSEVVDGNNLILDLPSTSTISNSEKIDNVVFQVPLVYDIARLMLNSFENSKS